MQTVNIPGFFHMIDTMTTEEIEAFLRRKGVYPPVVICDSNTDESVRHTFVWTWE